MESGAVLRLIPFLPFQDSFLVFIVKWIETRKIVLKRTDLMRFSTTSPTHHFIQILAPGFLLYDYYDLKVEEVSQGCM